MLFQTQLDLAELCQMFTIKYDMSIVNLIENAGLPIETSKLLIRICNSVINANNSTNNNHCGQRVNSLIRARSCGNTNHGNVVTSQHVIRGHRYHVVSYHGNSVLLLSGIKIRLFLCVFQCEKLDAGIFVIRSRRG